MAAPWMYMPIIPPPTSPLSILRPTTVRAASSGRTLVRPLSVELPLFLPPHDLQDKKPIASKLKPQASRLYLVETVG